jgi:selenide,water dikinase
MSETINKTPSPHLVLVGGGHAHAIVLEQLLKMPLDGVRVTMACRDPMTPYSGMLPGYVAGHYGFKDIHIDLPALCRRARVEFVADEVVGLDTQARSLSLAGGGVLHYDVVSINIGSAPETASVPGATGAVVPVKPISQFARRWEDLYRRVVESAHPLRIGVVGGGAGGTEMLLALHHRLNNQQNRGQSGCRQHLAPKFSLFMASQRPLPEHPPQVQQYFERLLKRRKIKVYAGVRVTRVEESTLHLDDNTRHTMDDVLWVTGAGAQSWLGDSNLKVDGRGFIQVAPTLASVSDSSVFAAGDCAAVIGFVRPKAGVHAVRQGLPLAENLRRALLGKPLQPYEPQKSILSLVSTGDASAVASRGGPLWAAGRWVWRWKDHIDRQFMRRFDDRGSA